MNVTELQSRLRSLGIDLIADGDRLKVRAARGQLSPELKAAIAKHRLELLKEFGEREEKESLSSERSKLGGQPLSFFQQRLWVLHRFDPADTSYNMAVLWEEGDRYNARQVAIAIRDVVERHIILRSKIVEGEDGTLQLGIQSGDKVQIEIKELNKIDEQHAGQLAAAAIDAAVGQAFDLAIEPPVRFQVWQHGSGQISILFSAHHMAVDAWSMTLLREEIKAACARLADPSSAVSAAPAVQYWEFAASQRRDADPGKIASQIKWWEERLAGIPPLCLFPPDVPPHERVKAGATFAFSIPAELADQVRGLGRAEGATLYMVLIAAFSVVLAAHSGQTDIVLGSPMGGRERADYEAVIGPFVNLLVLRLQLSDDATFAGLLRIARDAILDSHANRDVPFELLIERLKPVRSFDHPPLFQVAVVLHSAEAYSQAPIFSGGAIHDFTLFVRDDGGSLDCTVEYRADLYTPETIKRIATHFECILRVVSGNRNVALGDISLLSEEERHCVVDTFNNTTIDIDLTPIHVQIERQSLQTPNALALRFGSAEVTYADMN